MFNWKFIFPPIVLMLLLTYAFFQFPRLGDFDFHSTYKGDSNYPSGVAYLVNLIPLPQSLALFVFALLVSVVLPYILIFEITKNQTASWIYIFGSNIPSMLVSLYFVPQAVIQLFMLLSIFNAWFLPFFVLFGLFFHNQAWTALILTLAVIVWKRDCYQ
jgi:hypothetical protein